MMMPCRRSSSSRSLGESSTTWAMFCGGGPLRFGFNGRLVVYFDLSFIAKCADHLVTPGDNFVAFVQSADHFDVGGAGDAGLHLLEHGLVAFYDEHSLYFFLFGAQSDRIGSNRRVRLAVFLRVLLLEVALGSHGEGLNRNRERLWPDGGDDLGRARQAGSHFVQGVDKRDDDLKVLRFLAGDGRL